MTTTARVCRHPLRPTRGGWRTCDTCHATYPPEDTMPTPTPADEIRAAAETLRMEMARLTEQFAAWDARIAARIASHSDPDELPTTPAALRRAQLRRLGRAMAPDAPVPPAVRPQDATGGASATPAASGGVSGAPVGAQAFATHVHHDHDGDEWIHPGAAEDCDLPDCAEPNGEDVPEHELPPPAGLREEIAEQVGLHRNGPASDGRGWYRDEADHAECLTIADVALAVAQPRLAAAAEAAAQAEMDRGDAVNRARDAEHTIRRVRDECDQIEADHHGQHRDYHDGARHTLARVRAALNGTDTPKETDR